MFDRHDEHDDANVELVVDDGRDIQGPEQTAPEISTSEITAPETAERGISPTVAGGEIAQETSARGIASMAPAAEKSPAGPARDNQPEVGEVIGGADQLPSRQNDQAVRRGIFANFNPGARERSDARSEQSLGRDASTSISRDASSARHGEALDRGEPSQDRAGKPITRGDRQTVDANQRSQQGPEITKPVDDRRTRILAAIQKHARAIE